MASIYVLLVVILSRYFRNGGIQLSHAIENNTTSSFLELESQTQSSYQVTCIKKLCQYHFRTKHAMKGSLVIMNLTPDPTPYQSSIIESLDEDRNHEFSVMVKDSRKKHRNASHVSEKAQNYFMFIVTSEDVNSTVNQWHSLPTWNPLAQVIVLFTETYSTDLQDAETRLVLDKLLQHGMLNVNVMSHRIDTNIMQVVTWYPYASGNCAKEIRELTVIDECEYQIRDENDEENRHTAYAIYKPNRKVPKIPLTMNGCPLLVSSSVWEPYTFYDSNSNRFVKGIEVLLIYTIAQVLRLRPIFKYLNETRENRLSDRLPDAYAELQNR